MNNKEYMDWKFEKELDAFKLWIAAKSFDELMRIARATQKQLEYEEKRIDSLLDRETFINFMGNQFPKLES